jgi:hypothetical protein
LIWINFGDRSRTTTAVVAGDTSASAMIPTWYVTFEIRKSGILPKHRSPRETRTFATEGEAKLFARSKFEEGLAVFAGTINPHLPRRLIPAAGIQAWFADDNGAAVPRDVDSE